MNAKHIAIGDRPVADANAETWIRQGEASLTSAAVRAEIYTARLTLDITPLLRGRIKIAAIRQGLTMTELLRTLLEREFPE